jgi:hypothetical protein
VSQPHCRLRPALDETATRAISEITSAISDLHALRVADLVLVAPGSIPITTSGKIRRSTCAERYRSDDFKRLDVSAAVLAETWWRQEIDRRPSQSPEATPLQSFAKQ